MTKAVTPDLFGAPPPSAARDNTRVELALVEHPGGGTDKAWMLSLPGRGQTPKHVARSLVTRGAGTRAQFFTMPRWLAKERGWL